MVASLTVNDPRFKPWFGPAGDTDFTPNTLNQYTQAGSQALTYTTAGNLQNNGTLSFGYDSLNRLRTTGPDPTRPNASYAYDPLGRRNGKTVYYPAFATTYLYAGDRIIGEYSASGQLSKRFIYGPGIDEPVAIILVNQGAETTYYYHADRLGSVIGLTNSNGDLVESYHYTPYGQVYKPSAIGNPFLYTGREYDSESGLYHYRARAYDPILRRFLQPDPIGFADSMNLYAYVNNGPLNAVDPLGLSMSFDKNNDGIRDEDVESPFDYYLRTKGIASSYEELKRRQFWFTFNVGLALFGGGPAPFGAEFCGPKLLRSTNSKTGQGYGVNDTPVRIEGEWTVKDFKNALRGRSPQGLGSPDLHHAGQMPGSGIHELVPSHHRGNTALHPNKYNQGVTNRMRSQDTRLHWWYRARELGADKMFPTGIYD